MQEERSRVVGRTVNLNMPGFLSSHFGALVLVDAEVQYVAP
jgi:hypothetical protein